MATAYNPLAWYWLRASDGAIYSSASQATVLATDAGYKAWIAAGNAPSAWPNDATGAQTNASLYAVLQPWGIGASLAPAPTPAQLVASLAAYAENKQVALRDGGITINIGTASTPDEVNVASDVNGRSLVAGAVQLVGLATQSGQSAPTFPWINNGGTQITLTAPQMTSIGLTLGTFVQATYATLGSVLAAIAAGTITTTAQIDNPPAPILAWPATSY